MKVAVSVIGSLIVIEAGLFVPEYDPIPLPLQFVKLCWLLGVALIETAAPLPIHPLVGLTVPPVPCAIVR